MTISPFTAAAIFGVCISTAALIAIASLPRQPIPVVYIPLPAPTVDWFIQHPAEMRDRLAACRNNPGMGVNEPACVNAERAKSHLDVERVIQMFGKG